ncbi:MAG: hypothetical protein JOZ78_24715 [Chroococcidiopsidaceae cyanobacterium CP_BM_ER_R8_30]|nr:hypothetical protein [Chroococcidiopsidaceae cyanobacterium CP_BM_ER_R8_30]
MEIYVQSRGFSQEQGVSWLPEEPSLLRKYRVKDLIQSEVPTVVLARYDSRLLLLVTGLESSRTDFRDRKIRNSVMWVGENSNEPVLRSLAASALRGCLRKEIDQAIEFGGEDGFKVRWSAITQLALNSKAENHTPDERRILAPNSLEQVRKLAIEIEQYRLPSWNNCPLVVVTGIKAKSALESANVWRGLSSLVDREFIYPPLKSAGLHSRQTDKKQKEEKPLALIMLIVVIAGMVLLGILS